MLGAIFWLVGELITLYVYALIAAAIFSMLSAFGVLDTRNRVVWTIGDFLFRVTEPALRPIRRILPHFGGVDLSPLIAILVLEALGRMLGGLYMHLVMAGYGY